jgi:hypothetical protein
MRKGIATVVSIITLLLIRDVARNFGAFFEEELRFAAIIQLLFTIGMILVTLFLWRSVERKEDPAKFSNYKGPGFMYKDGTVVLPGGKIVPKEDVEKLSKASYTPPPSAYVPPPGMGDTIDNFTPREPYNPTMLKQPDYEDFFSDKKKAEGMGNVKPEKKEEPADMSDISLMPDAPIPEINNLPKAEINYFDDLIASEPEQSYEYDDPISDMNLEEYLSTDYLSNDKND